jgi:hypothetical protein
MLNFFGSLFHKTIVSFVGLAAILGLVSGAPQNATTTPTSSIPQIAAQPASSTSLSETIATPPSTDNKKSPITPSVRPGTVTNLLVLGSSFVNSRNRDSMTPLLGNQKKPDFSGLIFDTSLR